MHVWFQTPKERRPQRNNGYKITVNTRETSGLNNNGRTNDLPSATNCTSAAAPIRPAPTSPPASACVVEIGNQCHVAVGAGAAAPTPAGSPNTGCKLTSSGSAAPSPRESFSHRAHSFTLHTMIDALGDDGIRDQSWRCLRLGQCLRRQLRDF